MEWHPPTRVEQSPTRWHLPKVCSCKCWGDAIQNTTGLIKIKIIKIAKGPERVEAPG